MACANSSRDTAQHVRDVTVALLAEADAAAMKRWQTLDDAGLNREIELHRRSLREMSAQLDALGAGHPETPRTLTSTTAGATEEAAAATEAIEGAWVAGDALQPHAHLRGVPCCRIQGLVCTLYSRAIRRNSLLSSAVHASDSLTGSFSIHF